MCYDNCSYTTDTRALRRLLKEANAAAARACEAAKASEASACRAASLAKAAENAACQAEHSARVAQEAAHCAEEIAEKVRCMIDELLRANNGCGCFVGYNNYNNYARNNGCDSDCDC
ncbi:MAG: hypothetical protein E7400_02725 [Ruminococcaceae bacterium]|nr:hypothetical protein [Oscillospiraceae bacterium]